MNQGQLQANLIIMVCAILFLALCVGVLKVRNPQIEAQCISKGGQVLVTPGKFSSCLYSAK
jgi:hypothetical protein